MTNAKQLPRAGSPDGSDLPSSADRLAASKSTLLKWHVNTPEPQWSSYVLEQYISSILLAPGGSLDDVLFPVSEMIGEFQIPLTPTFAHFLKDLVIECFTQHREEYARIRWPLMLTMIGEAPTQAQCYFVLLALPPEKIPRTLAHTIVCGLKGTAWEAESASLLDDIRQETH